MIDEYLLVVSFGGGVNSTALLCGLRDRGIKPDLITFADTGAEHPHTYEHLYLMQIIVREWWGMGIEVCRKLYGGLFEGLEGQCNRRKELPSLAYGRRSCSQKYKVQPQERALKELMRKKAAMAAIRGIGFDAGEVHRVKQEHMEPKNLGKGRTVQNRYFLIEWGWNRDDCIKSIKRHDITLPSKSSCFFCPASKKREVLALASNHPELLQRALRIESDAQSTVRTKRGLGGEGNLWRDWLDRDCRQSKMFDWLEPHHVPCGCYDGGE